VNRCGTLRSFCLRLPDAPPSRDPFLSDKALTACLRHEPCHTSCPRRPSPLALLCSPCLVQVYWQHFSAAVRLSWDLYLHGYAGAGVSGGGGGKRMHVVVAAFAPGARS